MDSNLRRKDVTFLPSNVGGALGAPGRGRGKGRRCILAVVAVVEGEREGGAGSVCVLKLDVSFHTAMSVDIDGWRAYCFLHASNRR